MRPWFDQFLHWLRESDLGLDEARQRNNHGSYYDLQVAVYALYVDQPDLARQVIDAVPAKRIDVQIEPDGRQPLELARTKAWSYSLFNLTALLQLAALGDRMGVDLWHYQSPDGRGIRRAVEFLAPFGLMEKKWTYQELGGFSPRFIEPLLRKAAAEYPDSVFAARVSKQLPLEPANRDYLLVLKSSHSGDR